MNSLPFTAVNDSTTLSHEMVWAAIQTSDPAEAARLMREYATEADRVGAKDLAADLRKYAAGRQEDADLRAELSHPVDGWAENHYEDDSPFAAFVRHLDSDERNPIGSYSTDTLDEFASVARYLLTIPANAKSFVLGRTIDALADEFDRRGEQQELLGSDTRDSEGREDDDDSDEYPACPVCGDPIDYCQGHGDNLAEPDAPLTADETRLARQDLGLPAEPTCRCESSLCDHDSCGCPRPVDSRLVMAYVGSTCTQCAANMCATGGGEYVGLAPVTPAPAEWELVRMPERDEVVKVLPVGTDDPASGWDAKFLGLTGRADLPYSVRSCYGDGLGSAQRVGRIAVRVR